MHGDRIFNGNGEKRGGLLMKKPLQKLPTFTGL